MAQPKTVFKKFEGATKEIATDQTNKWIGDFSKHGVLHVASIVVVQRDKKWIGTVTYSEAK
jgi:hypothetical protein